ncbi:MAG: CDP-diacylglycerol--serine O-phosphatidyltransferase [Gammaproteobacteria bacterium]
MNILKLLKIADLFTMANLFCGILSIIMSMEERFDLSASLLFLAVIFDVLDGKIAGFLNQKNLFGKQIDSMSDLVSFGIAPMLLYYSINTPGVYVSMVLLLFIACGMLRLARYNISEAPGFEGVPITVNGILFPILFLIYSHFPESLIFWPAVILVQSLLMVSDFKVSRIF